MKNTLRYIMTVVYLLSAPLLILACLLLRILPKKFDVGMGPIPRIFYVRLAKSLRYKGYQVQTYANNTYFITSDFDVLFTKGWRKIFRYIAPFSFLRAAALYRSVYVAFSGGPLGSIPVLKLVEPYLFRISGVKTVVIPYGSDCRILDMSSNKAYVNAVHIDYPNIYFKNINKVRRQVEVWSRGADIVIGTLDCIDYMSFWNRVRHSLHSIDTKTIAAKYPKFQPEQPIKILHAPNHQAIKGSNFVFKAIDTLKREGYNVELIFKQGVPNDEFLKTIREADIVIDQLIIGWYGIFATEAMCLGKPVICYLRNDLIKAYESMGCIEPDEIPLINAGPSELVSVLREMLKSPETLSEIGQRSRSYAEKYHSSDTLSDFFSEINKSVNIYPSSV